MTKMPPNYKELLGLLIKIVSALESRRPYAIGHSQRVADLARAMAEHMGLSSEESSQIYLAGLLHDMGYLVMPDDILQSNEPLTPQQREIVDSQLQVGLQILDSVSLLGPVSRLIRYHLNRFDGQDTPNDLKGEELPLGSRILHVAHVFEALSSDRPHRRKLCYRAALNEITANQGKFDPAVVEALIAVLRLDTADDRPEQVELDEFTQELDDAFEDTADGRIQAPAVPGAMSLIRKLMQDDGLSLRQFSAIIELEPALALKIISTANSSLYYGMPPVSAISDALVRIGLNEARSLMITFVYQTLFKASQLVLRQIMQSWWEQALLRAAACRSLSENLGMANRHYAYLAGLLSNIGKPALLRVFVSQSGERQLTEWQLDVLLARIDFWHHRTGAGLLKEAHLPNSLVEALKRSDQPVFLKRNREALLLLMAKEVVKSVLGEDRRAGNPLQDIIAEHNLEIEPQDLNRAFAATLRRYNSLQGLMSATDSDQIDHQTLLMSLYSS